MDDPLWLPTKFCGIEKFVQILKDNSLDEQMKILALKDEIDYFITLGADSVVVPFITRINDEAIENSKEIDIDYSQSDSFRMIKSACPDNVKIGGHITYLGIPAEPFGDITHDELILAYTKIATSQKNNGCDFFYIEGLRHLGEYRAAVLACRELLLPMLVMVNIDETGETFTDATPLSHLIPLQELGVSALGVKFDSGVQDTSLINTLTLHGKIPFISHSCVSGISLYNVKELHNNAEDDFIISSDNNAFFINPEIAVFSEPLKCDGIIEEELIAFDDQNVDVVVVEIYSKEDAIYFGKNSHFSELPVCIRAYNSEDLETALKYYHGRALIDTKTSIPRAELEKLSNLYGAVLY